MNREFQHYEHIFKLLLEADSKIWEAVTAIQDEEDSSLKDYLYPLMEVRGALHVQLFRPMYKRFPELAEASGMNEVDSDS